MADGSRIQPAIRMTRPVVEDVAYLARRQSADAIEQWFALTGFTRYEPDHAARAIVATLGPDCFCMVDADDRAIALGGFDEVRPGVLSAWMVAAEDAWTRHGRAITREARRVIHALLACGRAHRVEVYALASRQHAHRWYEALGMAYEGTHRRYYTTGADAVCYARVKE